MRMRNKKGFTLIEVLIVVGIIALLMTVLVVAVIPMMGRGNVQATRTLLVNVGPLTSRTPAPTLETFRRDAGPLASEIAADDDVAHSQMILFYLAPSNEVWTVAPLYRDRNYNPDIPPEQFTNFTRQDPGRMPHLVDAWETPLRWHVDTHMGAIFIISAGPDQAFGTDDDLVYDPRMDQVRTREELN
jgi:prepilin-type N-terminal cleavage/methylation domain-containing protein